MTVRNASSTACLLPGPEAVTATDPNLPDVAATKTTAFGSWPPAGVLTSHASALLALDAPGYCNAHPGGGSYTQPPLYGHLRIELAQGGGTLTLTLPKRVGLGCGLEATAFGIQQPPTVEPPDLLDNLRVSLQVPASVRAGDEFTYAVTLSNISNQPVRLTPCPGYIQAAWAGAGSGAYVKQAYALNCTPIGILKPEQKAQFEMRMTIPTDVPPGILTIGWSIGAPLLNAGATTTITITPLSGTHT